MHFCLQISPGYTDKNISYVLEGICEGLKAVDKWLSLLIVPRQIRGNDKHISQSCILRLLSIA